MRSFGLLVLLVGVALASAKLYNEEDPYERCGPAEKYSPCDANPTCQRTCAHPGDGPLPCVKSSRLCVPGCVCKDGYVRTEFYGRCIHRNRCPRVRH